MRKKISVRRRIMWCTSTSKVRRRLRRSATVIRSRSNRFSPIHAHFFTEKPCLSCARSAVSAAGTRSERGTAARGPASSPSCMRRRYSGRAGGGRAPAIARGVPVRTVDAPPDGRITSPVGRPEDRPVCSSQPCSGHELSTERGRPPLEDVRTTTARRTSSPERPRGAGRRGRPPPPGRPVGTGPSASRTRTLRPVRPHGEWL